MIEALIGFGVQGYVIALEGLVRTHAGEHAKLQ